MDIYLSFRVLITEVRGYRSEVSSESLLNTRFVESSSKRDPGKSSVSSAAGGSQRGDGYESDGANSVVTDFLNKKGGVDK